MLRLSLLLVVFAALAGCGGSDPVKSSRDQALRANTVPIGNLNTTPVKDSNFPNNFLAVTILNQDKDSGNFIEEKAGEVQFQITPYPGISSYVVSATNNPPGSSLRQSSTNPNIYFFDWTPPKGTVAEEHSVKPIDVHLVVAPKTNDPRYINLISEKNLALSVVKIGTHPTVVKVEDSSNGKVDENGSIKFSVVVSDPSQTDTPPTIAISPYNPENVEDQRAFGFIQPDPQPDTESLGGGQWREHFVFSVAGIDLEHSNLTKIKDSSGKVVVKNTVEVCANFTVISSSKMASLDSLPKCWTVTLSGQAPEYVFLGSPAIDGTINVTAAPDMKVEFDASIPNKRGRAQITANLDRWPGNPSLDCKNGDGNDSTFQKCTITWADGCKAKSNTLVVSGTNLDAIVGGAPKTSHSTRKIVVAPATSGCDTATQKTVSPAPAPTVTDRVARDAQGASLPDDVPAVMTPGDSSTKAQKLVAAKKAKSASDASGSTGGNP